MSLALCCFALATCAALADDPEPPDTRVKPREITIVASKTIANALRIKFTSADELAKVHGKEIAHAIAKAVDFKKEYVIAHAWTGSAGDRMEAKLEGKKVTFTRTHGRTSDLRRHFKVYVLPNDYTYARGK